MFRSRIFASVGAASTKTLFETSPDITTALKESVAFIYFSWTEKLETTRSLICERTCNMSIFSLGFSPYERNLP